MMDCKYFKELISGYIDGFLNEEEKKLLEKHFSSCGNCWEYFNKLKRYKENLSKIEKIEVPLGFEKRVMEKIEKKEEKKIFLFNKKFIFQFSAVLVVLVSVFLVYLNLNKKEELQKIIIEEKMLQSSKEDSQDVKKMKTKEVLKEKTTEKEKSGMRLLENKKEKEISKTPTLISQKAELEKIKEGKISPEGSIAETQKIKAEEKKEIKEQIILTESIKASEKKEVKGLAEVVPMRAPSFDVTQTGLSWENKLRIRIRYDKFDEIFKKVEENLKEENIKYEKKEIKEKNFEIMISFEDLQKFLNKIKEIEGINIEGTDSLKKEGKIKIEFLSF